MTRSNGQDGFALVLAVFVITVLAALGAYILTVSGVQHQTSVLTLQQTRALNAARSGVQWASYKALTEKTCPTDSTISARAQTLSRFDIQIVRCEKSKHTIGGKAIDIFVIEVKASSKNPESTGYAMRKLTATIHD
jgi:MSHA biogenesis protein MshP